MYLKTDEQKECYGCYSCYNICPTNSIEMLEDLEGFVYPNIDIESCINCGKCIEVCPYKSDLPDITGNWKSKIYVARSNDKKNLKLSSSGGIFSELAEVIIKKRGLVYGVGFDEVFKAVHKSVSNMSDINVLRGSKYIQSEIGLLLRDIKEHLDAGKYILFCGTPCQVKGLKNYLGTRYTRLFTIDFVCHGVPSFKIFRKYLDSIEDNYNSKIVSIDFRNKENGWTLYNQKIVFESGEYYKSNKLNNPFMMGFRNNAYLRPSCYCCEFAMKERFSEITLGDFWGLNVFHPLFYKDIGASLLMINSSQGNKLFQLIKDNIEFEESTINKALKSNGCLSQPSAKHNMRDKIIEEILISDNFEDIIFNYFDYKKSDLLKNKVKVNLKKIISIYKRFANKTSIMKG